MPSIDPWAILKNVRCGQVVTIDPALSPEFAGDYEVVQRRVLPLTQSGSLAGGAASGTLVRSANHDAGQIELVLRRFTLDRFTDEADEPTYAVVPDADWAALE